MGDITLYLDFISQPSRTVYAFCLLSHIPVKLVEIRIAKLQHLTQSYEKINPMRKVPAIHDSSNNLCLGESHAIMRYLIRKNRLQSHWQFDQQINAAIICAKVDQYLHYHHSNTRKCARLLYQLVFSKLYHIGLTNTNTINSQDLKDKTKSCNLIYQEVKAVFAFIENQYFVESQFMIGKQLTMADLSAFFQIQSLIILNFPFQKWPKISKWMTKMNSIQQLRQANQNFMKVLPKMRLNKPSL